MKIYSILNTSKAKINFLKGLIRVSKSDGIIEDSEKVFFAQTAEKLGLSEAETKIINDCWECCIEDIQITFDRLVEKNFFFIQAIQLCWIDGGYTKEEKEEIEKIADELSYNLKSLEAIEAWVAEGIEWNKKGDCLLKLK